MIHQALFYFFATLASIAAIMVIVSKNPVRAVLCLILTFFMTACIWLLLESEFLAIALILVYVGAVMVLFLFVVMMLDIEVESFKEGFTKYLPLGVCVPVLLLVFLIYGTGPHDFGPEGVQRPNYLPDTYNTVVELAKVLFTQHLLAFELAGVILLVAMIASIVLCFRGTQKRKAQTPSEQVKVQKQDRLKIMQVDQSSTAWPQDFPKETKP